MCYDSEQSRSHMGWSLMASAGAQPCASVSLSAKERVGEPAWKWCKEEGAALGQAAGLLQGGGTADPLPSGQRIGPQFGFSPRCTEVAVSPHARPMGKSHPLPRAGLEKR